MGYLYVQRAPLRIPPPGRSALLHFSNPALPPSALPASCIWCPSHLDEPPIYFSD